MNEKVQRVKKHFSDNKKLYVGVGIGLAVGATVTYVAIKHTDILESDDVVKFVNIIRGDHNTINQVVSVNMVRPGPKSFVVQCLETQKTWPSIRQAAKDLGVDPNLICGHLKGTLDDVKGMHFEKIAEL